jgi:hypothetical protein
MVVGAFCVTKVMQHELAQNSIIVFYMIWVLCTPYNL